MLFLAVLLAGGCLFLQQEQGTARPRYVAQYLVRVSSSTSHCLSGRPGSITAEAREGKKRRSKKSKQAKKESESGKDTLLTASTDSLKSLATDEDDGEPPFPPSEHLQQEQVPKQSRKLVLGAAKPEPSAGDSPGMLFDYEDGMDPGQEEAEEDGGWELVRAPKRSGSREKLSAAGKASTGPKGMRRACVLPAWCASVCRHVAAGRDGSLAPLD
eukprot:scaffold1847_cov343-Prasinococcus_capsulatus_cf.AAC.8